MSEITLKITPTEILEYLYCPRFIYFMNVLKISQHEDRRYKVQKGREVHEKRLQENTDYLWKKIGAVERLSNVYLHSEKHHLHGLVDEVVRLADDSWAPLDFKFSLYPEHVYTSHKMQILAYCIMIEEFLDKEVKNGYLFYIRDGSRQVTVPFTSRDRRRLLEIIDDILETIQGERLPVKTGVTSRCRDCTYKNICV